MEAVEPRCSSCGSVTSVKKIYIPGDQMLARRGDERGDDGDDVGGKVGNDEREDNNEDGDDE